MSEPRLLPVAAVLFADHRAHDLALETLEDRFGPVLLASEPFEFRFTDYYREEVGETPGKRYFVFSPAVDDPSLASWKLWSVGREKALAAVLGPAGLRRANLDPGLLSPGSLSLASTKEAGHRTYLGGGIFADVELLWKGGGFQPMDWTYRDYRSPLALSFFTRARKILLDLRRRRPPEEGP